jgi:hypothetical protein
MAKNIIPENMETILLKSWIAQLMTLNDDVNNKLAAIPARLDVIEAKMMQQSSMPAHPEAQATLPDGLSVSSSLSVVEAASRMLSPVERKKEEIKQHARNVVVSGLAPFAGYTDIELLETVCEQYLTVKPHILRVRRFGMDRTMPISKLCATLNFSDAVDDIIKSSRILRHSENAYVRQNFYFNHDLTEQQADAAYKRMVDKRVQRNRPSNNAMDLNPAAQLFRAESC